MERRENLARTSHLGLWQSFALKCQFFERNWLHVTYMIYTTHTPSRYSKCTLYYTNWKVVHKMCVKTEDWRQRLKFVHNQKLISSAFTVIYPSISAICSLNCTFLNFFWTMKNVMRLPKRIEFFFQAKVEIFLYDGVIKISLGWANLHDGDSFMWVIKVFFNGSYDYFL